MKSWDSLTAAESIKITILLLAMDNNDLDRKELNINFMEEIEELYKEFSKQYPEYEENFRHGTEVTDIPCQWNRNYDSKSVAAKTFDGRWVGWTFWSGGGKHGEPEAIDWMKDAYFLKCKEKQEVVITRTFKKIESL